MAESFAVALQQLVDHVTAISGVQLVWKDADHVLGRSLPSHLINQRHPCCLHVKHGLGLAQTCFAWCGRPGRALDTADGRGRCHAGFIQWRWRVQLSTVSGKEWMGDACLGPCSLEHPDLPAPPNDTMLHALQGLVTSSIQGLATLRQYALGDVERSHLHVCLQELCRQLQQSPGYGISAEGVGRTSGAERVSVAAPVS